MSAATSPLTSGRSVVRLLAGITAALLLAACGKRISYTQALELAPGEPATAEISMRLRENCPWGQECGDTGYAITRLTLQLTQPESLRSIEWSGPSYAPVFLGRVGDDLHLVLFARHCFGPDGELIPAHPVLRWNGKDWQRVPRSTIPADLDANLVLTYGWPSLDGQRYSREKVAERLAQQIDNNPYARAAAELDFDKWYGLHYSRCAGEHDRN